MSNKQPKLVVRAVMLGKDEEFQDYVLTHIRWNRPECFGDKEENCRTFIISFCGINSRSELTTNPKAQAKFQELDNKYKDWQAGNRYKENFEREKALRPE